MNRFVIGRIVYDRSFCTLVFCFLFVFQLHPMDLKVLGYQSHLLQRCHPACGHEGSSHLSPVLDLRMFIAMQIQHSCNYG